MSSIEKLTAQCPRCKSHRTWDQSIANGGAGHLCYTCGLKFELEDGDAHPEPKAELIELSVPPVFFDDTYASDCFLDWDPTADDYRNQRGRRITVRLTERDAHELLDRADFYASSVADMEGHFGLCMSARATAKAIRKQWPEASPPRF